MIYHLVWASDWEELTEDGLYRPESLRLEGFVHCTREPEKLIEVANLFFAAKRNEDLLRLTLDPSKLASEIRDEDPGVGHLFPHVYGPIETAAVIAVDRMRQGPTGWQLPSGA